MNRITKIQMPQSLIDLRDQVLKRSQKRMPKWKFRIAPDVVVQLQPKPDREFIVWEGHFPDQVKHHALLQFEGVIVTCDGADAAALAKQSGLEAYARRDVQIAIIKGEWCMLRDGGGGRVASHLQGRAWSDAMDPLRDKANTALPTALAAGMFDVVTPANMLTAQCLICGKKLTDPVSKARGIGPECAGTTSNKVPRLYLLDEARP